MYVSVAPKFNCLISLLAYCILLLLRSVQVPDIPQAVQSGGGVAEHVAGGGEAFGLGGVNEGEVSAMISWA